jgi:ADP-heptose:LPS heptosyltransferase
MTFPSTLLTQSVNVLARVLAPRGHRSHRYGPPKIAFVSLIPNLGDTVMLLPLIDAVRQFHPNAEIYCVCNQSAAPLLRLHSGIQRVLSVRLYPVPGSRFRVLRVAGRLFQMAIAVRIDIASLYPDICILPRGGVDPYMSAVLAYWSGALDCIGCTEQIEPEKSSYSWGSDQLLTRIIDTRPIVAEVNRGMALLRAANLIASDQNISPLDFPIKSLISMALAARADAKNIGLIEVLGRQRYVIISPGGSQHYRQWSPERFAEAACCIRESHELAIVLIGTAGESSLCQTIASLTGPETLSLAGKTSLAELLIVLKGAALFLGNDSGPAHLAAGLGVPTVIISAFAASGPCGHHNSPWRSRPCGPFVRIIQPETPALPCKMECRASAPHCIEKVKVADVISAADSIATKGERGLCNN